MLPESTFKCRMHQDIDPDYPDKNCTDPEGHVGLFGERGITIDIVSMGRFQLHYIQLLLL